VPKRSLYYRALAKTQDELLRTLKRRDLGDSDEIPLLPEVESKIHDALRKQNRGSEEQIRALETACGEMKQRLREARAQLDEANTNLEEGRRERDSDARRIEKLKREMAE
jgi:predicted  nucleic acid-binding Zn-ribbon protein